MGTIRPKSNNDDHSIGHSSPAPHSSKPGKTGAGRLIKQVKDAGKNTSEAIKTSFEKKMASTKETFTKKAKQLNEKLTKTADTLQVNKAAASLQKVGDAIGKTALGKTLQTEEARISSHLAKEKREKDALADVDTVFADSASFIEVSEELYPFPPQQHSPKSIANFLKSIPEKDRQNLAAFFQSAAEFPVGVKDVSGIQTYLTHIQDFEKAEPRSNNILEKLSKGWQNLFSGRVSSRQLLKDLKALNKAFQQVNETTLANVEKLRKINIGIKFIEQDIETIKQDEGSKTEGTLANMKRQDSEGQLRAAIAQRDQLEAVIPRLEDGNVVLLPVSEEGKAPVTAKADPKYLELLAKLTNREL